MYVYPSKYIKSIKTCISFNMISPVCPRDLGNMSEVFSRAVPLNSLLKISEHLQVPYFGHLLKFLPVFSLFKNTCTSTYLFSCHVKFFFSFPDTPSSCASEAFNHSVAVTHYSGYGIFVCMCCLLAALPALQVQCRLHG